MIFRGNPFFFDDDMKEEIMEYFKIMNTERY